MAGNNWTIEQDADLRLGAQTPQIWPNALMLTGDNLAHTWRVRVFDGGEAVALTGATVTGYFVRTDGNTVAVQGSAEGNTAAVTLAQACYAFEGDLKGVMRLTLGGKTVTLSVLTLMVRKVLTDAIIDPGNVIPSLEDLLAQIEAMETATAAADTAAWAANSAATAASGAADTASAAAAAATDAADMASTGEAARVTAEQERASAETARAAAETARANAETQRAENEETRQAALTAAINSAAASAQTALAAAGTAESKAAAAGESAAGAAASAASASTSADSAASSATTAQDAQEAVEGFAESIAKEPTAQSILSVMQQELALLQQIVEEGTGGKGDLNGFSFSRGESGELIISYTNPDDETDTAIATFATKTLANFIAQELASINESLHTIAGTDNTAQTEG